MSEINFSLLKSYDGNVSDAEFNKLVDVTSRLVLCNGTNYTVRRNAGGTVIQPKPGGATFAACPFDVSLSHISGSSDLNVSIRPGLVNNILPDNMFAAFTATSGELTYVKAEITTDGQNVTSVSLSVETDEPDTQNATASSLPTDFDIVLAVISGQAYRTIGCGSLSLTPVQAFVTDKDPPAGPGESTTIPYYVYNVGVV